MNRRIDHEKIEKENNQQRKAQENYSISKSYSRLCGYRKPEQKFHNRIEIMTVQELIDTLNSIENKSKPIYHYYLVDVEKIEEHENEVIID